MNEPLDPRRLLEHNEWLHTLAQHLVLDSDDARELVQDTWLIALETPASRVVSLRAWLSTVLRNLARRRHRDSARRRRREERAANDERVEPNDDVVDRAELYRRLTDHVLALDEPSRSTLLLRYFDGLSAAEIARRTSVPASTVRVRLKRALDQLRGRLDADCDRGRWLSLLILPGSGHLASHSHSTPGAGVLGSIAASILAALAPLGVAFLGLAITIAVIATTAADESTRASSERSMENEAIPVGVRDQNAARSGIARTAVRAPKQQPYRPTHGAFAATVVEVSSQRPVAGASLRLEHPDRAPVWTMTNEKGRAQIAQIEPGNYQLTWSGTHLLSPSTRDRMSISIRRGEEAQERLELDRGTTVMGRVVERSGAPVADARVVAIPLSSRENQRFTHTDPDGRFRLGCVRGQRYRLRAATSPLQTSTPAVSEVSEPIAVFDRDYEVELVVSSGSSIRGVVVDENEDPLSEATVHFGSPYLEGFFCVASEDGEFAVTNLPSATYSLSVEWNDTVFLRQVATLELPRGTALDDYALQIRVSLENSIVGSVRGVAGVPMPAQSVLLTDTDGVVGEQLTDERGRFRFIGVEPGRYSLEVGAKRLAVHAGSPDLEIVLADGDSDEDEDSLDVGDLFQVGAKRPSDLAPSPPAPQVGWVFDKEGRPVAGAVIRPAATSSDEIGISDQDGTFDVSPGSIPSTTWVAQHPHYVSGRGQWHGDRFEFVLERGIDLSGRVTLGTRPANGQVRVTPATGVTVTAPLEDSGAFHMRLTPGRATVTVIVEDSGQRRDFFREIHISNEDHRCDLSLPSLDSTLVGRVARDGWPSAHYELAVTVRTPADTVGGIPIRFRTDADGYFEIGALPEGRATVRRYPYEPDTDAEEEEILWTGNLRTRATTEANFAPADK